MKCHHCGGKGSVMPGGGLMGNAEEICDVCNGTGKAKRCEYVYEGERCEEAAIPDNEGGKCAGCGKNHCRDHLVPDWHFCKTKEVRDVR